MKNLKELYINFNKLNILPQEICQLINLETLSCSYNKIKSIIGIGKLISLKKMYFSDNELEFLPSEIKFLTNLDQINVENNKLKNLPEEICELLYINDITCYNNYITRLPSNIGKLTSLNHLTCDHEKLLSLPKSFVYLINLQCISNFDQFDIKGQWRTNKNIFILNCNLRKSTFVKIICLLYKLNIFGINY